MANFTEERQRQEDAIWDNRESSGPKEKAVMKQFSPASQAEMIRAADKDDHYASYVYNACHDTFRHLFGTRLSVTYQNEIKLAGQTLYYLMTTGSGLQTLGEEYCDLYQVTSSSGVPPTPARRILFIFFQSAFPYLAERLSSRVAARGVLLASGYSDESYGRFGVGSSLPDGGSDHASHSSSSSANRDTAVIRWSRLTERVKKTWLVAVQKWPLILPSVREASQLVMRTNLMLFYFEGLYYHIAKRAAGILYVFIGRPLPEKPRYQILGIFLLIQLCIIGGDWLRQSSLSSLANVMGSRSMGNELTTAGKGPPVVSEDGHLISDNPMGTAASSSSSKLIETRGLSKCPLCLSPRQNPTATSCGHIFCWNCVTEWCNEKPECPLCRSPVSHSDLVCIYHADF